MPQETELELSKEPSAVIEGVYNVLEHRITMEGEPYGGTLLKVTAVSRSLICQVCGALSRKQEAKGLITDDWIAMQHVLDTGHRVATDRWSGAVYGPE